MLLHASIMPRPTRKIALLGSTGSIGCATIDVVTACAGHLELVALSAHGRLSELCSQARRLCPKYVIATDAEAAQRHDWSALPRETTLLTGPDAVELVVSGDDVDVVVAAVVGSAGLMGAWSAAAAGKTVAIANKEALVMAGPQLMRLAAERRATILPIDSEHSAVFQLLHTEHAHRQDVKRIVLTASGGPFREWSAAEMQTATVADALAHPTWRMGPKITIDSATMMNKALEIIEAR